MKKTEAWKHEFGLKEASQKEIQHLESFPGKRVALSTLLKPQKPSSKKADKPLLNR